MPRPITAQISILSALVEVYYKGKNLWEASTAEVPEAVRPRCMSSMSWTTSQEISPEDCHRIVTVLVVLSDTPGRASWVGTPYQSALLHRSVEDNKLGMNHANDFSRRIHHIDSCGERVT